MFLNFLNSEEKITFLKLAISVIQADGKLEESENHISVIILEKWESQNLI